MPYVGAGGVANPMQIATCTKCGADTQRNFQCPACSISLRLPFVAVYEIGQGNCNALIDSRGKILAYFDFGYSTSGKTQPDQAFVPCFCDTPMIILSHWDLDHISLVKQYPQALTMRWLVPEQAHSDIAGAVMARIKDAGGELCVFPARDATHTYEHMTFPWGFVERCMADNQHDPNGSGLAAFVCVRDTHRAPQPGRVNDRAVAAAAAAGPAARARAAAQGVAAEVALQLGNAADIKLARPVAAMLAASQTIVGRQPLMPVAECVSAAVRAAIAARAGQNQGQIEATLAVAPDLPMLQGAQAAWWTDVVTELAEATLAALPERSAKKRAQVAGAKFTRDGHFKPKKHTDLDAWSWIGMASMAPAMPALPALFRGHARITRSERFILLNGDANFNWVPSMVRRTRPTIATMTAMHHGAIFEDKLSLSTDYIPYAPRSKAANAVARLWQSAGDGTVATVSLVEFVSKAAFALRKPGMRRKDLRIAVSRAARAAAAAIYATDAAHPNEIGADPAKFAAVAAAAAVASARSRDAAVVGVAACLASTTVNTCGDMGASPIETVIELARKGIAARRAAAALDLEGVRAAARGGVDGDLLPHLITIFDDAVTNGHQPLTADNVGGNAATAHSILVRDAAVGISSAQAKSYRTRIKLDRADQDVINDVASAATAAMEACKRPGRRRRKGPPPPRRNGGPIRPKKRRKHSVRTATNAAARAIGSGAVANAAAIWNSVKDTTRRGYWAAPAAFVDLAAWTAAKLAAEKMAALILGTTAEAVRVVIGTVRDKKKRNNAIYVSGARYMRHPLTGRIAYSYGISNDAAKEHGFSKQTKTAGYMGHPHPMAVMRYEAHGWIARANTSRRARHAQPQGDPDSRHPIGHVALAWDSAADLPMSEEPFVHKCSTCRRGYTLRS